VVHRDGAERGVVGLERHRERIRHTCVTGAQHHVEVRVRALEHFPIRPRVGRAATVEVDMRSNQRGDTRAVVCGMRGFRRPVGAGKKAVDLRPKPRRIAGVGAAGVGGGTHRAQPEGVLERSAPLPEAVAVQEPGSIESLDDVGDLLRRGSLVVPAPEDLLDLLDRMLPVEERHQVQQDGREHGDLIGEAGGIPEGDAALPFVLDGKGLEGPEPRVTGGGHSASR
jgi:hypothetical protein